MPLVTSAASPQILDFFYFAPSPERNRPWANPCADGLNEVLHLIDLKSFCRLGLSQPWCGLQNEG